MRLSPPTCPKCKYQLTWGDLEAHFECPGCKVELKSNYFSVLVFIAVVLPLPVLLYVPSDTMWAILVGGALLLVASLWVFAKLIYVRLAREPNAT